MLRNTRLQMMAVLAIGLAGGWLAASGRLPTLLRAQASTQTPAATTTPAALCCDGADHGLALAAAATPVDPPPPRAGQPGGRKPNIVFIMGDDSGWFNSGAYHQGMRSGKTPNLDNLASQGMRFTDYYA